MFLIRSHHPHPGPTLNAIPPAPDRAARRNRNLDRCEELGELGMDLARAAHREALRDMQPPLERTPIPGATYGYTPAPPPRDAIFGQLFSLISRCVRQTMLLEDRLAAGDTHPTPDTFARGHMPPPPPAEHNGDHTRIHPDRLRPETLEDETRAAAANRPAHMTLDGIRAQLDLVMTAGLTPGTQNAAPASYRRPIPLIPPGPTAPLSAAERSALEYHQQHPSRKKPDG